METCEKHPHEIGVALCGRCGASWCAHCLVYVFGPKKAPFCIECAMVAGGVRSAAGRPALSRREMKARVKQARAAAAQESAPLAPPEPDLLDLPAPQPRSEPQVEPVAAATDAAPELAPTDWATPWWEDRAPTLAD